MKPYIFALALLCAASATSAQDPRLSARFQGAALTRVTNIVEQAAARGIPREPVVQKILEGASKQAGVDKIEEVLRAYLVRLETAQAQLGSSARSEELTAGASALYVGVAPEALSRLRALRPDESLAMPLTALAFFVQRGVAADASFQWIERMVRANVAPDEFGQLQQLIDGDVRAGADVRAASAARIEAVLVRYRRQS